MASPFQVELVRTGKIQHERDQSCASDKAGRVKENRHKQFLERKGPNMSLNGGGQYTEHQGNWDQMYEQVPPDSP